jgi:hypothetical protein
MDTDREFDILFYLLVPVLIMAVAIGHAFIASLLRYQHGMGVYASATIISASLGLLFAFLFHRIAVSGKKMLEASLAGSIVISLVYGYQRSIYEMLREIEEQFRAISGQTGAGTGNSTGGVGSGLDPSTAGIGNIFGTYAQFNPDIAFFTAFIVFNLPFIYYIYQRGIDRTLYLLYLGVPVIYGATVLILRLIRG